MKKRQQRLVAAVYFGAVLLFLAMISPSSALYVPLGTVLVDLAIAYLLIKSRHLPSAQTSAKWKTLGKTLPLLLVAVAVISFFVHTLWLNRTLNACCTFLWLYYLLTTPKQK